VAEELKIKVDAETGAAVANLKKVETATANVKKEVKSLDGAAKKSGEAIGDSVSKNVSSFTKLAEGVGKVTMIFGLAVAAGKALSAGIDAISASMAKADKAAEEAAVRTIKFEAALRLANKGIIDLGGSTEEMLRNYDAYIEKTQRSTTATQEATRALAEYQMALDGIAEVTKAAAASMAFSIMTPEEAEKQLDSIKSLGIGLENALRKAFEGGGEEERAKWAAANEEAVQKVIAAYEKMGKEIPAHLAAVAAAREQDVSGFMAWVDAMNEATRAIEAQRSAINDLDVAASQWRQSQQQMANLSGQTKEFMAAAEEQYRRTGEAIYTMTIMSLDFTKATEDQIDALKRMDEQLAATWEDTGAGQRAADQIASLVALFKAGSISLDGFNKSFAYLEEQLDRVIKAGGDLDGSLAGVLDGLRKIAQQVRMGPAGARPSGPVGY
jgi:hypothetical protein